MAAPLPDALDIVVEVERTIAAVKPGPEAAGLVALARAYAAQIAYAEASQNALRDLGPKLTTVLIALGASRVPPPSATGQDPVDVELDRLLAGEVDGP